MLLLSQKANIACGLMLLCVWMALKSLDCMSGAHFGESLLQLLEPNLTLICSPEKKKNQANNLTLESLHIAHLICIY